MQSFQTHFSIEECGNLVIFLNEQSMNFTWTPEQRALFHQFGQELYFYLDHLQSVTFDKGTDTLKLASSDLKKVSSRLDDAANKLDNIAETLKLVDSLITHLSTFLRIISPIAA